VRPLRLAASPTCVSMVADMSLATTRPFGQLAPPLGEFGYQRHRRDPGPACRHQREPCPASFQLHRPTLLRLRLPTWPSQAQPIPTSSSIQLDDFTHLTPPRRESLPQASKLTWPRACGTHFRSWLRLLRKSGRARELGPALDGSDGVFPPQPIGSGGWGSIERGELGFSALVRLSWAMAAGSWRAVPGV
jgi:hypothetical protein